MILCADDYGLRDDIDAAILALCDAGRLSAVSCLVVLERCDAGRLKQLLAYQKRLDIGLHLCFTEEGLPWSAGALGNGAGRAPSFGRLLRGAVTGRVRVEEMVEQVAAQYELFVQKAGRGPDHIDGHLHAHQLPGVREAVMQFVGGLPESQRPYIRNTTMALPRLWRRRLPWVKAAFIGALGRSMARRMRRAGVRTNRGFAGIYDFAKWRHYPQYLPQFINCLEGKPNGILVVHPGKDEAWRRQEFLALQAFPFPPGTLNCFQAEPGDGLPSQGCGATPTSTIPLP